MTRRSFGSAQATVAAYAFDPGAAFPRHRHDEEQITIVCECSAELEVAGRPRRLLPGDAYVVTGGVGDGLRAGPDGARFLAVVVPRRARSDAYTVLS